MGPAGFMNYKDEDRRQKNKIYMRKRRIFNQYTQNELMNIMKQNSLNIKRISIFAHVKLVKGFISHTDKQTNNNNQKKYRNTTQLFPIFEEIIYKKKKKKK